MVKDEPKNDDNNGTGSVRLDNAEVKSTPQVQLPNLTGVTKQISDDEPDFMKYIRGVNMNHDDRAYLQSHFDEEEPNMEQ